MTSRKRATGLLDDISDGRCLLARWNGPRSCTHTEGGEDSQVSETVVPISCTQREVGEAGKKPLPVHPKLPLPPLPVQTKLPLPPLPTCAAQAASLAALPTGPVPSRLSASSTSKGTSSATCSRGSGRYCLGGKGGGAMMPRAPQRGHRRQPAVLLSRGVAGTA